MTRRFLSLSILSVALVSCDSGSDDAAADSAKPVADSARPAADSAKPAADSAKPAADSAKPAADSAKPANAKDATKKAAFKPNSFARPSATEVAAAKKTLAQHLNAGRKAVKAGDHATGIAELTKAIALNPAHGKTLGELGWAHFKAGDLDAARVWLDKGAHHAKQPKTQGAILYNLGRVAEEKGDKDGAIIYYGQSLQVRPNDTVKERLVGLGGTPPKPDGSQQPAESAKHPECGWQKHGPTPRHLCHAYLQGLPAGEDSRTCEYESTRPLTPADVGGGEVAVAAGESSEVTVWDVTHDGVQVAAFSYWDFDDGLEHVIMNVSIDGTWFSSELAWVNHPGVGYSDENMESLVLRTNKKVVPGGRPEIVARWAVQGHDLDPGVDEENFWSYENMATFSIDGSAPAWLAAVQTDAVDEWGPMEKDPTEVRKSGAKVKFGEGKITVSRVGDSTMPGGSFAVGAYPLRCPMEIP